MKLDPYPEYRESGQPFLGNIPAHWNLFRNGRLFSQRNETGFGELPILEVSLKTGVRVRDMENPNRKQMMSDRDKYKRAARGDIAYNMMRMWQGAVGVAPVDGLVSPAYVVARPFPGVDCRYFNYLFRTPSYMSEVDAYSRGIVKDRNRLYWQDFKRMPSPVPPIDEQRRIGGFLDAFDKNVRRFVRNKRRLIELLREQMQNVINRAVTRGLDPDVTLRPSGVEWLGDIPEHWEVRKLKFVSRLIVGGATPASGQSDLWDGGIVWITPKDVSKSERLRSSDRTLTSSGVASCSTVIVPPGSVIMTSRAPVGNVSLAEVELCTNQGCKAFVPDERFLLSEYIFSLLKAMQPMFQRMANGTTFLEISTGTFKNIKIPLPAKAEQEQILSHIQEVTASIDHAVSRAEREIELMREYRTRLISDVVTGKVDVRGVEAPEVLGEEPPEPDDDADESDDVIDDGGDKDETD
jgi:type I restriction enzyme S subunit